MYHYVQKKTQKLFQKIQFLDAYRKTYLNRPNLNSKYKMCELEALTVAL